MKPLSAVLNSAFAVTFASLVAVSPVRSAERRADWRADWERTVESAKKEGQVNVHVEFWGEILDTGVFQKSYPEIRVMGVKGRGAEFQQRILAERRAGRYLVDVVSAGITTTLTVKPIWKEGSGLASQSGTLSLMNQAPHPNAGKVFINWFLSREGQVTLQRALARSGSGVPDSLRIDISKDEVPPDNRRQDGISYLDMDAPGRRDMGPVIKLFEESMAEAKKSK